MMEKMLKAFWGTDIGGGHYFVIENKTLLMNLSELSIVSGIPSLLWYEQMKFISGTRSP